MNEDTKGSDLVLDKMRDAAAANDKPLILGPDANPVQSAKEAEKTAVIYAKLCMEHPANVGVTIDEEKAVDSLKKEKLVCVELPPNCLIADASTRLPDESRALVQLANRAIAVARSRGAVKLPVSEQIHWAKAFVILFQRLNAQRMERIQLGVELRSLFESHAKYADEVKLEAAQREAAFVDGVRESYIAGALFAFAAADRAIGEQKETALEESVKIYLDSLAKDPEEKPAEEPNSVTKAEMNDKSALAQAGEDPKP